MTFPSAYVRSVAAVVVVCLMLSAQLCAAEQRRSATVDDSINMTLFGERGAEFFVDDPIVLPSPNRKQFAVLSRRGDTKSNSNVYSLLLYEVADLLRSPRPSILVRFASTTNSEAISDVRWMGDNETLLFIGARGNGKRQVYSVNARTHALRRLTEHQTDVVAFDASDDLRTLVYEASAPPTDLLSKESRNRGVVVDDQPMSDLLIGNTTDVAALYPPRLFVLRDGRVRQVEVPHGTGILSDISMSPDSAHAIIRSYIAIRDRPVSWKYTDTFFGWTKLLTYSAVDLKTLSVHLLIDAPAQPVFGDLKIVWTRNGNSAIVTNTYLPLDVDDEKELTRRQSHTFSAEVEIENGAIHEIDESAKCVLVDWDRVQNKLVVGPQDAYEIHSNQVGECKKAAYEKRDGQWQAAPIDREKSSTGVGAAVIQGMNEAPKLWAWNEKDGKKVVILDPNPGLQNLDIVKVQEITVSGSDGNSAKAGLYVPSNYKPGMRVPLVIQTHGWSPRRFEFDGESSAGYAAQVLADQGIAVAQLDMARPLDGNEGKKNMELYERLIDQLDTMGLIDRERVALQGWSRTGYHARYALSFSKYPFAAALVVDGYEAGYASYIMVTPLNLKSGDTTSELMNGGKPFGQGLATWLARSPEFNLDKVQTPVLQFMFGRYSIEDMWESFAGLRRLNKPVEMIYLPDSNHWPIRPSDREVVQQGAVDWFRFWLQGYEDPRPEKSGQYRRWESLCEAQRMQNPDRPVFCPETHHP